MFSPLPAGIFAYSQRHPTLPGPVRWALALVAGLLVFTASGFSEMFGALQMAALILLALAVIAFGSSSTKRSLLPALVASLLGSGLGMAVVILAPGNQVRAANFPPPPQLLALLGLALQFTADFLRAALLRDPLSLLAAAAIPAALGSGWLWPTASAARFSTRALAATLLLTPVAGAALLAAAFAAPAFGLSAAPPARALIVPAFVLVMALVTWGFALGGLVRRIAPNGVKGPASIVFQVALAAALLVYSASLFRAAQQNLARQPIFEAYAAAWDEFAAANPRPPARRMPPASRFLR